MKSCYKNSSVYFVLTSKYGLILTTLINYTNLFIFINCLKNSSICTSDNISFEIALLNRYVRKYKKNKRELRFNNELNFFYLKKQLRYNFNHIHK